MALRDISLTDWARMSDEAARRECEALVRMLPHGLTFSGLEPHTYCGREHRIARFRVGEGDDVTEFVLVPGGEVSLGFDGHDFKPTEEQIESFVEEPDIDQSIEEFVNAQTSAPRVAHLAPMLVEVEAREIGVEPVGPDDPVFVELCRELERDGREGTLTIEFQGVRLDGYIVQRNDAGICRARRRRAMTLADVETGLAALGMRLPTCDEWEYACGAGASTLFRWGDDSPTEFHPFGASAEDLEETTWLRGGMPAPWEPPPVWDLHERPNLFGLRIAMNPYRVDLVADGPRALGGDGGGNMHADAALFFCWLPLATAFRDPNGGWWSEHEKNVANSYCRLRRVISVP